MLAVCVWYGSSWQGKDPPYMFLKSCALRTSASHHDSFLSFMISLLAHPPNASSSLLCLSPLVLWVGRSLVQSTNSPTFFNQETAPLFLLISHQNHCVHVVQIMSVHDNSFEQRGKAISY